MSKKIFECDDEFPSHTDLTVKTPQVLSEAPMNSAPLPQQRNYPQLAVDNKQRPRRGHAV